ncbi:MAG: hypothetical protein HUJ71_07130 [Pseudobutyrivibrio sp.]|nr:hypothetical protein [Pseudobutyrivibrio sp.]
MGDIVEILDINGEPIKAVSPYDANYPVALLRDNLKRTIDQAQNAANAICKAVAKEAPIVSEIQKGMKQGTKYVVDMSDELIKAIDEGTIKLQQTKEGKLCAQLMQSDGKFGSKLGIKKEVLKGEMVPTQITNALQMAALQEQIQSIAEQIVTIDRSVRDVLQGQQNDRIGLYYSGLAMYLEAKNTDNESLRQALLVQALRSLAESTFQLELTMQSDIKYLVDREYLSERGKKVKMIDERMSSINKAFEFIHQASLLRAAIYCDQGEMKAMTTALGEYSHFIENTVAKNAALLAQCDVSDTGEMAGLWNNRAELKLDVSELEQKLTAKEKVFYIGFAEAENEAG